MFIDTVGYSKLSMNEQRVAIDHRFQKLVAKAIVPEGEIIDVFSAAGLKQPDISILSDQFLAEVRGRRESQKDECRRKKFRRFLFIILPSNFASHPSKAFEFSAVTAMQQRPGSPNAHEEVRPWQRCATAFMIASYAAELRVG